MGKSICFIGAGNMAEALIKGILANGLAGADRVRVSDINQERLRYFKQEYGVDGFADNVQAVENADVVFLAIKPQQFAEVLPDLKDTLEKTKALVVSIAAGITTTRIEQQIGGIRVVRVMPNTPALVACGVAGICSGTYAQEEDMALVGDVFKAIGTVVRVDESLMDTVTAVSGSGPAYAFYLIESMQRAGEQMGLDPVTARTLVLNTIRGAVELCDQTGEEASVLRERVTSKGGTTAAALDVFNKQQVHATIIHAMQAACDRSRELAVG